MKNTLIALFIGLTFLVTGCATQSYFGVPNRAAGVPDSFQPTQDAIAKAENSPGAKYCPEKIAKAKELAKKGVETFWACRDKEAADLLAEARNLAREAESCQPPKQAQITPPPAPQPAPTTPAPVTPPPAPKKEIIFKAVYAGTGSSHFKFDHSDLTPAGRAVEDENAAVLKENPDVKVEIAGHTDSVGTEKYNQALSERRANTVYNYLVSKGISKDRFRVVGYGELKPATSNATAEGRAKNRRVELNVIK